MLARAAERRLANAGRVKATRSVWNRSAGAGSSFGSGDARSFIEKTPVRGGACRHARRRGWQLQNTKRPNFGLIGLIVLIWPNFL